MATQHEYTALHEVSHIETPEHIALQFQLAGVASRAFAYIIDFFVQLVPLMAALIAAVVFAPEMLVGKAYMVESKGHIEMSLLAKAVAALAVFCVNFGYFFLFEILWRGQTPGKRAMGLRVLREGGYAVDPRAALIRNLLRAIDFLPTFYLLGMGMVFWGRAGKRLGDYAAGTMVIREAAYEPSPQETHDVRLQRTAGSTPAGPPQNHRLTPQERALVVQFFARAEGLHPAARDKVAGLLAANIAARMGSVAPDADDAESYLQKWVRDVDR